MRYFIYCRKSLESEDRQILSIESQRAELMRVFTAQKNIEIVEIIEESFSAKAPGRSLFNAMIARAERGEADGIISWAPDRLARNSIDGGRIIYLLDTGILCDLKFATYTFENNPQGKFMLQIMFGQSKYYSDALSENVKRGNRAKVAKGWRPNKAPLGYLNEPVSRTIVVDPERFPLIRRMFDLMLSGTYSPRSICRIARDEWGFRTPKRKRTGGSPVVLSAVYKILNNPFYAGILLWDGKTYAGRHKPVVSIEEFDRAQALLKRVEKPRPHARTFPFTGIIRCGECGLMVTVEEKINRHGSHYTYYHCSRRKFDYRCLQRSVTADDLLNQIRQFVETISVPVSIHAWALKCLQRSEAERKEEEQTRRQSVGNAIVLNSRSLENLTSLRVRDLIDDDQFVVERNKLKRERLALDQNIETANRAGVAFEPTEVLVLFSNRAVEWFLAGDDDAKRLILESVGSNPCLKDRKLNVVAKKPFRIIEKMNDRPQLRSVVEDIRTLWINKDPELLKILENIEKLEVKFGVTLVKGRAARPASSARASRAARRA